MTARNPMPVSSSNASTTSMSTQPLRNRFRRQKLDSTTSSTSQGSSSKSDSSKGKGRLRNLWHRITNRDSSARVVVNNDKPSPSAADAKVARIVRKNTLPQERV
jgi:hypothetical protein